MFDPSNENPLFCHCYTCHRRFYCPIYDILPNNDVCVKKHNDGANARKCGVCGCHRSLHKPPSSISPSCSHKITQNSVINTVFLLEGDIMLIDDNDECLEEPLTKRLKLSDVVSNVNVTPLSSVKVKLSKL